MKSLKRRYLQFNELVFDSYEVNIDYAVSFRSATVPYAYGSGSLPSVRKGTQLVGEQSLSLTIRQSTKDVPCDQYYLYKQYILTNITKPGRIWAVEGKNVLWAYAFVADYSELYDDGLGYFELSVDFVIWEGFWHRADKRKVFFYPYNTCHFNLGDDYQEEVGDCCCGECPVDLGFSCGKCLDECNSVVETLCESEAEIIPGLYTTCTPEYKLRYDCDLALKRWGEEGLWGNKVCKDAICEEMIDGRFFSDTILDTNGIVLTITGKLKNPYLVLNENAVLIKGEYNGTLTVTGLGEMTYQTDPCCEPEALDPNLMEVPYGSTFGMTVHHGWNTIHLETGDCCSMACVYYKIDAITI